jgi:hypothetical protein
MLMPRGSQAKTAVVMVQRFDASARLGRTVMLAVLGIRIASPPLAARVKPRSLAY